MALSEAGCLLNDHAGGVVTHIGHRACHRAHNSRGGLGGGLGGLGRLAAGVVVGVSGLGVVALVGLPHVLGVAEADTLDLGNALDLIAVCPAASAADTALGTLISALQGGDSRLILRLQPLQGFLIFRLQLLKLGVIGRFRGVQLRLRLLLCRFDLVLDRRLLRLLLAVELGVLLVLDGLPQGLFQADDLLFPLRPVLVGAGIGQLGLGCVQPLLGRGDGGVQILILTQLPAGLDFLVDPVDNSIEPLLLQGQLLLDLGFFLLVGLPGGVLLGRLRPRSAVFPFPARFRSNFSDMLKA